MKRLLICATVLLFSAVQAWAADDFVGQGGQQPSKATQALKPIYFVPGIADNTASPYRRLGVPLLKTYIHCSSVSSHVERIRVVIRARDGSIAANVTYPIKPGYSYTFATTYSPLFGYEPYRPSINLNTGIVTQGLAIVSATSEYLVCSASSIGIGDSGAAATALHMVRVNPIPNTVE
jgi:hypothetical protein